MHTCARTHLRTRTGGTFGRGLAPANGVSPPCRGWVAIATPRHATYIYARGRVTYTCTRAPLALGAFESEPKGCRRRTKEESTTGRMRTATEGRTGGRRGIPLPPLDKPNRSRCASAGRNSPSVGPPPPIRRCHPPGFLPSRFPHPPTEPTVPVI